MGKLRRYVPVLEWLPRYDGAWFARDTIAGITVWALLVPEAMAYAGIAGVPVQFGLYAVPLALLGYVIFGSSRRLFVGPSATVATISGSTIAGLLAASAPQSDYIALTATLALLVGVIYVVAGALRMGFIARFFALPVLAGFIIGLGIFVAVGQFPKLVGIEKPAGDTVAVFVRTIADAGNWEGTTVLVGAVALVLLFALAHWLPKAPAALMVVALAIGASKAFDLGAHGVALVGTVPKGFDLTSWSGVTANQIIGLLPGALAIVIVGFAQSIAIAKAYAAKEHSTVDANQELLGYGAANIGAGALQGYTVTGSLSKTAASEQAGGRTPLLLVVTAFAVILTILVLAPVFDDLPETVLAAVVIQAVWGMLSLRPLVALWQTRLAEVWLGVGALLGVIVVGILPGVVIGVALSFALLIRRLDNPTISIERQDGALIYTWSAPLVFANSEVFTRSVVRRIHEESPKPSVLIVDCEGISQLDTTGSNELRQLHEMLQSMGIRLFLARPNEGFLDFLSSDGVLDELGVDSVYPKIHEAVAAAHERVPVNG